MPTNYVLIDFENVQPKNLSLLETQPFKVLVFIGASQVRLPRNVVTAMQKLGERAEYIEIDGNGPNALDFHVAYYVGALVSADPDGAYHIVSKDKGFDPLVRHLKRRKVNVRRVKDLAEIPILRIPKKTAKDDMIDAIVNNLINRGQSRPRKVQTLKNTIGNLVSDKLSDTERQALVDEMQKRKLLRVSKDNIRYTLPTK